MPKYRVILEFDHPGDGVPIEDHSNTNSPAKWHWGKKIGLAEVKNIQVKIYEKKDFELINTQSYPQGEEW